MEAKHYKLAGAVKDLHDLFQQINPAGPYRMALFHDRKSRASGQPTWFKLEAARIDTYLRGAACLLANDLAESAAPVIAIAWQHIKASALKIGFTQQSEPVYFSYLSSELDRAEVMTKSQTYRILGEVLAVYLDLLCSLGFDETGLVAPEVDQLRGVIAKVGVVNGGGEASG